MGFGSKNDPSKVKSVVLYESITEGLPVGKERIIEEGITIVSLRSLISMKRLKSLRIKNKVYNYE